MRFQLPNKVQVGKFQLNREQLKKVLIGAVALLLVWMGYSFYQKKRAEIEASLVRPIPVMAVQVVQRDMPLLAQAFGDLRAYDIAKLAAQTSGNITEIDFNGGENVKAGDVLMVIDNATQTANLQKANAQATLSQVDYDRMVNLVKRGAQPQQALDQAKARLEESQADVTAAQDALDKTIVKAPFNGRLGARLVSIGDFVSPGQHLADIVNLNTLKVQYSVPEQYLSMLAVGQDVEITTTAYPDQVFVGEVDYVAPLVDPVTRSISVEGLIENQDDKLAPGLSTQVSQVLNLDTHALVIPEESLVYALEGASVYLAEDDPEFELDKRVKEQILAQQSAQLKKPVDELPPLQIKKVKRVNVQTSTFKDGMVQITKGLKKDDWVVTQGQQKLRDGVPVIIVDPHKRLEAAAAAEKK